MTAHERLREDLERIEKRAHALNPLRKHWRGEPDTAFLSESSRKALEGRLSTLSVNFPRLLVNSYVDRMNLTGWTDEDGQPDAGAWNRHRAAGLVHRAELVHTDRLMYGAAYVTVWPERCGPAVVLDNPFTMTVDMDPLTGDVSRAVRTWRHAGAQHALVIDAETVTRWRCDAPDLGAAGEWCVVGKPSPSAFTADGLVPVVPFVRRMSTDDHTGTSVAADILDLTDAENKLMADAMVTSESYARPRRWATGLEIQEDDDGNPVDPFGRDRSLQSEDPDTRFGQFDPARLDSYADMSATITQMIGAITGLPAHYLGLHGDQPAAAEGVRAAEAQLTSRVFSELRAMDLPWSRVAGLVALAADRDMAAPPRLEPVWASPEIRTPGQAADAAAKLHGIGVPLRSLLSETMGWTPEQVDAAMADRRDELVDRAAAGLSVTTRGTSGRQ